MANRDDRCEGGVHYGCSCSGCTSCDKARARVAELEAASRSVADNIRDNQGRDVPASAAGAYERVLRAALTGSDLGPFDSPTLWADVRDGSPTDVGWDSDDSGCSRCGADPGAQCSFIDGSGYGVEVGGWVHVERLEATDPDRGPGEGE